ncbi:unnamed protein product [Polarella glacialis]|uniref:Uncharacterized protein n=1 Tax=Polarella glacialis TaxID=89957 RepID=A0A813JZ51_POLGL|nr:unnamed protein product [Polarella glacialis]
MHWFLKSTRSNATWSSAAELDTADEPLLSAWWAKSRSWNVKIGKKDMRATKISLGMPGGGVVLGNGRLALCAGSHLLSTGYFYAFQIDAIDDEHFPLDRMGNLSFGFGISHLPPRSKSLPEPRLVKSFLGNCLDRIPVRRKFVEGTHENSPERCFAFVSSSYI